MEDISRSSDSDNNLIGVENPLLVNSVVETLFSFLALDNLKICRYVCKIWGCEAFRSLRKLTCIKISRPFLRSNEASKFTRFNFKISEWDHLISSYFKSTTPNAIEVDIEIFLSKEYMAESVEKIDDLLRTQSNTLTKLTIRVDSQGTLRLNIPESLLLLKYPELRKLAITNQQIDPAWLHPLWISVVGSSPQLDTLELHNINNERFCKEICSSPRFKYLKEVRYTHDHNAHILRMHQELIQSSLPSNLRRLQVSFAERSAEFITSLLQKVAPTLEILEFHTKDESALSPIDFPIMSNLLVLDAGNSQFSFPSITTEKFPKLVDIKATYWDWVYTFEELPDVHYYWGITDPHRGISSIHIRFPNWTTTNVAYARLENFEDFADVLNTKFPNACEFTVYNVPSSDDIRRNLEKFVEVFEFKMRTFTIATYSTSEVVAADVFELSVDESSTQRRELTALDLGSKEWTGIWRNHQTLLGGMRNEWLPNLQYFEELRVLKLLWASQLLPKLGLTNPVKLPKLEHLEFVGNACVNRHERASVRRMRPELRMIQWKTCYCAEEEWWYINDPDSGQIFVNLFSPRRKSRHRIIPTILNEAFGRIGFKTGK